MLRKQPTATSTESRPRRNSDMLDTKVVWYRDIIFRLGVVFVLLSFTDAFTTWYALDHFNQFQAVEMNPFLNPLSYSGWMVVFKTVSPAVVLVGLFYLRRIHKYFYAAVPIGLFIGCLFLIGVVANNIIGLFLLS